MTDGDDVGWSFQATQKPNEHRHQISRRPFGMENVQAVQIGGWRLRSLNTADI
ncbi:hypothetical protein [Sphingomonas sp. Root710]|uniref:hypothetical protein n=1 Tax=Sphingomonas sp. Root710 TaxID=1736594 RepID=UPI0012E39566|nr:hypothetical protein [Sphingomonas sp. Root710]